MRLWKKRLDEIEKFLEECIKELYTDIGYIKGTAERLNCIHICYKIEGSVMNENRKNWTE